MLRIIKTSKDLSIVLPASSLRPITDTVSLFRLNPVILRVNFMSLYPGTCPNPLLLSHLNPSNISLIKEQ